MTNTSWNEALVKKIQKGALVLTPNRRLAATIQKVFQQQMLHQGIKAWVSPLILPSVTWQEKIWREQIQPHRKNPVLLLNAIQSHHLWENIISTSTTSEGLLNISETAKLAKSAWDLINQWCIDIEDAEFKLREDSQILYQWCKSYIERCERWHAIDSNQLLKEIIHTVEKGNLKLPTHILLLGFNEFPPLFKTFIDACRNNNVHVEEYFSSNRAQSIHKLALQDTNAEIYQMANWAKAIHKNDETAFIGCIIPNLDTIRDKVSTIFNEVFVGEINHSNTQQLDYNISAGKPLPQYPVIKAAIHLLQLLTSNPDNQLLTFILTTPFLGDADQEQILRIKFDAYLKQKNIHQIELEPLINLLSRFTPKLAKRIQNAWTYRQQLSKHLSCDEWVNVIHEFLNLLGWPGERSLNSEEYQTVEAWFKLLNDFKCLDYISVSMTCGQMLHQLNLTASKLIFQPQSPEANIQILGILEAAALPFDYLWVSGLDDLSWPPQPKPNPLLPKRLQRKLQMPHATAERELNYCQYMTTQFTQNAKVVCFSHALASEETLLTESPLIRNFDTIKIEDLPAVDFISLNKKIFQTRDLEFINDNTAPPLSSITEIRGGVNVIKQQSLCPFKAFTEWRLHARELETSSIGIRAKDRGTVFHKALELIWQKIKDQHTLLSLSQDEKTEIIKTCIEEAASSLQPAHASQPTYVKLEKKRLFKLIEKWLVLETQRPAFKVLLQEDAVTVSLEDAKYSLRIDRIDQLEDNSLLVIDYKTSKYNDINDWFSERPSEPQLPLYALTHAEQIAGLCIAQVSAYEQCFKGISQEEINIKGIKTLAKVKKADASDWPAQITAWENHLKQLSHDFISGNAEVNPKDPLETCMWCHCRSFCRINEEVAHDDNMH